MILFILSRVLFIASMVFIIGYVFGNFSRNRTLTRITKVATILAVVFFMGSNLFFARAGFRNGMRNNAAYGWHCEKGDSTITR
jgi:hypothetical protein